LYSNPEIKEALVSILSYGKNSPLLNKFIRICCWLGLPVLRKSIYMEHLINMSGLCDKDMMTDIIGELFECVEGKFIRIENFIKRSASVNYHTPLPTEEIHEDILSAMLITLVSSRVKQGISDLRNEYGEIYFSIKKAMDICLERNDDFFKEINFMDDRIIFTCIPDALNFELPFMPNELVLEIMFYKNLKNNFVTEAVRNIFVHLNKENEHLKAIKYKELLNVLTEFYKKRLKDNVFAI